ncbi:MAG: PIG-L family deacetylase [Chloroflexales bacterium]|nr:PIG-L family deacetylase [Chloroflexales bacterium]
MLNQLRILIIGAHPDDCEFTAAGTAALWAKRGDRVCFVSVSNGDAGHHELGGARLAQRRHGEALAAAAIIGIDYVILDNHDGEILPTLSIRYQLIDLIRTYKPDLILSPRPNDYHPDHRYTAQLIQDAAYMVTVPNVRAGVPNLMYNPVIAYVSDTFQKPYPFAPDVVVAIDATVEAKVDMLDCHVSQVYEWLPWNGGYLNDVPAEASARREWLRNRLEQRLQRDAQTFRNKLIATYGDVHGATIKYAEAFEGCEYGSPLDADAISRLFPFVGK